MGVKLGVNCFFKNFGEKQKVGDGLQFADVVGVKTRFLQYWSDSSSFEQCGGNS